MRLYAVSLILMAASMLTGVDMSAGNLFKQLHSAAPKLAAPKLSEIVPSMQQNRTVGTSWVSSGAAPQTSICQHYEAGAGIYSDCMRSEGELKGYYKDL